MKPIVPGCLAIVIMGVHTGKTMRCESKHHYGETIRAPDGNEYLFIPADSKDGRPCWIVIGDLTARHTNGGSVNGGRGWGLLPEVALLRIDSEGDEDLNDQFVMEDYGHDLEQRLKSERKLF